MSPWHDHVYMYTDAHGRPVLTLQPYTQQLSELAEVFDLARQHGHDVTFSPQGWWAPGTSLIQLRPK